MLIVKNKCLLWFIDIALTILDILKKALLFCLTKILIVLKSGKIWTEKSGSEIIEFNDFFQGQNFCLSQNDPYTHAKVDPLNAQSKVSAKIINWPFT